MSSQLLKIKYLECTRGNLHEGEQLNTVCLNPECQVNALCCCVCIEELHKGHPTTTLKKILLDTGKTLSSTDQNQQVKPKKMFNADIILNLIESSKKLTLESFHRLKNEIHQMLNKIEINLEKYYNRVQQKVLNPDLNSKKNQQILQSIQTLQASPDYIAANSALQKLLTRLQSIGDNSILTSCHQQLCQDSLLNLIEHSNHKAYNSSIGVLKNFRESLIESHSSTEQSVSSIDDLFSHKIFYFSSELKSPKIRLNSSNEIICKQNKQYQVALMQPSISSEVTGFKYCIKPNSSKWIAFGVCYKNIVKGKNFCFDYRTPGHGCYMISSNGGVWSNSREDLNNIVKAFSFKQGDIITCLVNKHQKKIFFIKDSRSNIKGREMYNMPYTDIASDELHPCVVFFFENDAVQYIPAIGLNELATYQYLFDEKTCHPKLNLINKHTVRSLDINEYRAAVCTKSLQPDEPAQSRKFSFKINRSTNNWLAVGVCHIVNAAKSHYTFNYQSAGHGYYMISSNGGSWSSIDPKNNNTVKSFKFSTGDIVECEVVFGEDQDQGKSRIMFRKGGDMFEVEIRKIKGDPLHPCVMMYYANDEVEMLPGF